MSNIEIIDDVDICRPGRPLSSRTNEIQQALMLAKSQGKFGLKVPLEEDELEAFHRFTQRCRSAAKKAGVKVSISLSKDKSSANVKVLSD